MTSSDAAAAANDDPGPDATFGPSCDDVVDELLELCDEFLRRHASPEVHAELRAFLADRGHHHVTGLGAFLDALSLARGRS